MTANRLMGWGRLAVGGNALPSLFGPERPVDRVENFLCRPKRGGQRDFGEQPLGIAMTLFERALHFREHLGRRALEGEDGLLLVADCEDGSVLGSRARAGKKLGAQRRKDAPLRTRGVLRFIEQQVIEPIVELVQHPRGARTRHQRQRTRDLVIEIERAALGLHPRESRQDRSCDDEQGGAAFKCQRRAPALAQGEQAVLLATQSVLERGGRQSQVFGRNRAVFASARLALAAILEKRVEQRLDTSLANTILIRRAQVRSNLLVVVLAGLKRLRPSLASHAADVATKHFAFDAHYRYTRRKTEGSTKRVGVAQGVVVAAEDLGAAERLRQKLVEFGRA